MREQYTTAPRKPQLRLQHSVVITLLCSTPVAALRLQHDGLHNTGPDDMMGTISPREGIIINQRTKGTLAAVLASVFYGIGPVFTKTALANYNNPNMIIFYRFILSAIAMLIYTRIFKISLKISRKQLLMVVIFGVIGYGLTDYLLTFSFLYISSGIAVVLHFSYPTIVSVLAVLIFKEKFSLRNVIAIVVAFAGIILMSDISGKLYVKGVVLALCSGVAYSMFVLANRHKELSSIPTAAVVFYVSMLGCIPALIIGVVQAEELVPVNITVWAALVIGAIISTVLALLMITSAIRLLGASRTSIINMLEPLISVLGGIIVFNEVMSPLMGVGMVLILAGAFITIISSSKKNGAAP